MSRRLVVPDIHGCFKTLLALLDKIGLNKTDTIFFLGDYIDKGKDSAAVLDILIGLKEQNYNLVTLRGNHEENLLTTQKDLGDKMFKLFVKKINKSPMLLDSEGEIIGKYRSFCENLIDYVELPDFLLVHGGFDTRQDNPFVYRQAMLELRRFEYDANKLNNKRVIHGHQVHHLVTIKKAIETQAMIIPLDNGCVYTQPHKIHDFQQLGQLCCFNLDTWELITQPNIDN
jgi:serine/threonine protein phosphatase 1